MTRGNDTLAGQDAIKKSLNDIQEKYKGQLGSPEQQLKFSSTVRPFFDRYLGGQVATHAEQQGHEFAVKTTTDSYNQALEMAANAGSDGDTGHIEVAKMKALQAQLKTLQINGQESDPAAIAQAKTAANIGVYKSAAEAMAVKNPLGAQAFIEKRKDDLGIAYAPLAEQVRTRADRATAEGAADQEIHKAAAPGASGTTSVDFKNVSFGTDSSGPVRSDNLTPQTQTALQNLGKTFGPVTVTSSTGGGHAEDSFHYRGQAVDISIAGMNDAQKQELIEDGRKAGFTGFGIGATHVHMDTRVTANGQAVAFPDAYAGPVAGKDVAGWQQHLNAIEGVAPSVAQGPDAIANAIHGQESGGRANSVTSVNGAVGGWQVTPATFARYARPGENISNPADNETVGRRIIADLNERYHGDAQRVAVAYFSGEGNVAPPGSATPWKEDKKDGNGTSVSSYVSGVLGRMGSAPTIGAAPANATPVTTSEGPSFEPTPTAPDGTPIQPAAFNPSGPTAPQPVARGNTPEDIKARATQGLMERTDLTDDQKKIGYERIQFAYAAAATAAQATEKAKKERVDSGVDEYVTQALKAAAGTNSYDWFLNAPAKIANDPRFAGDGEIKLKMYDMVNKLSGGNVRLDYGNQYTKLHSQLLLPYGDPNKITDKRAILMSEGDGLTPSGVAKLGRDFDEVNKDAQGLGRQTQIQSAMKYLYDNVAKPVESPGIEPRRNIVGEEKYNAFISGNFFPQLNEWIQGKDGKGGKDPNDFFQKKHLDEMVNTIWPKSERDYAQLHAGAAPPAGLDVTKWAPVADAVPQGVTPDQWSKALTMLISNPRAAVPQFNASGWAKAGLRGEDILARLGVPYVSTPGKPEDVGAQPPSAMVAQPLPPATPHVPEVVPPSELPPGSIGRGAPPRGPAQYRPDDSGTGPSLTDLGPVVKRALQSPRQRREEDEKK